MAVPVNVIDALDLLTDKDDVRADQDGVVIRMWAR